jgi:hypothetical protein
MPILGQLSCGIHLNGLVLFVKLNVNIFSTMEIFLLPKPNDQQFSIIQLMVAQFPPLT